MLLRLSSVPDITAAVLDRLSVSGGDSNREDSKPLPNHTLRCESGVNQQFKEDASGRKWPDLFLELFTPSFETSFSGRHAGFAL